MGASSNAAPICAPSCACWNASSSARSSDPMTDTGPDKGPNADQAAYWQSRAGQKWVTHQATLDRLFENVLAETLARAAPQPGERVLDIGCGWGGLACHAARHYGVEVHGVTLSPAQLAYGQA
ncbi:MAG: hypothetical protein CMN15_09850, partial [Roseovarius sp.]|nr:hypothetical protein [Roseovarius sp.]